MEFSQENIVEIVYRSSSIDERLKQYWFLQHSQTNDNIINTRLEKWCQRVAQGDREKFNKYLTWHSLELNIIHSVLDSFTTIDKDLSVNIILETLPDWVETLKAAINEAGKVYLEILKTNNSNNYYNSNAAEPLPFEELFLPFVNVARQKVIAQTNSNYSLLLKSAHITLERSLLKQLSDLASQAMELQFSIFRHFQKSPLTYLLTLDQNSPGQEQYKAFIQTMLGEKLISFFREYSVLARLLSVATDLWVESITEFINRLASDWSDIQHTFQYKKNLGQVAVVVPALSDPHNNGRSTISVEFTSGLKLIYKPKDLGTEQAYFKLLTWFNDQNAPLTFKILQVLNCATHGWVEFVEHLPCKNIEEAKRYYQRAGMHLCLIHALKGNDCHSGNIIACGEHPILVDLETLLNHRIAEEEKQEEIVEIQSLVNKNLENSVLRTGFLPQWHFSQDKQVADLSGLGAVDEQDVSFRVRRWQNINTDSMKIKYENKKMLLSSNVPSLNGVNLCPEDYVEDIVTGFRQMYLFLLAHRDAILAPNGPLAVLAHQKVRFVFRNTSVYYSLLQKTSHPKFLRDGVDRSIEFDILSRPFLAHDSKPFFWELLQVEKQALAQLDIPYFSACTDSNRLSISPSQNIENFFQESSYDLVVSYLNQLNNADLEQEIGFIRGSLSSRIMPKLHNSFLSAKSDVNLTAINPLTPEEIMMAVKIIAAELKQRAICAADGNTTWITLAYLPEAEKYKLQAMNYGLYDGSCGVALFLAALERVTGGTGFRHLALGALQSVSQNLQKPKLTHKIAKKIGIGGGMGLGSIIYTFVRSSQFLDEPDLLKDARYISSLITPEFIAADDKFDIIFGSAGTILGLLALYKTSGDAAILEQAITCGYHLLNHRTASNSGYRIWATLNGRLLTGMSHGAAGIAYALLQLYAMTQEQVFRDAAEEAIAYEQSVFSSQAGNWPDFRTPTNSDGSFAFATNWCNGASGIGLARLGSLPILDNEKVRQDIEIALKTTLDYGLDGIDHLCCGNFGRIELLLAASRYVSRMDLLETAQKQAAIVVARAEKVGSFGLLSGFNKNIYLLGFFQGITGIGYELLRLAYPDLLPSVLLWE